jgi:coenzyme PQQ synthesis protein D (PqqD)
MEDAAALDRVVRVPNDVIFRELQGEAVILNLASSTYFGLDQVATRIWQLCEAHGSLRTVWEAMQQEFDASDETLKADLLSFVDELLANGLLAVQPHAA